MFQCRNCPDSSVITEPELLAPFTRQRQAEGTRLWDLQSQLFQNEVSCTPAAGSPTLGEGAQGSGLLEERPAPTCEGRSTEVSFVKMERRVSSNCKWQRPKQTLTYSLHVGDLAVISGDQTTKTVGICWAPVTSKNAWPSKSPPAQGLVGRRGSSGERHHQVCQASESSVGTPPWWPVQRQ